LNNRYPRGAGSGDFVILHKISRATLAASKPPIWLPRARQNSLYRKLDTHVDTHTCEKIRKNAVKHIQFVSMKQEVEIPTRQLYKPSDGDSQYGAGNGTRTHDLRITNALLYQLSYTSKNLQKHLQST
jgi:hypothetical protein